jgi:hypothetical protein
MKIVNQKLPKNLQGYLLGDTAGINILRVYKESEQHRLKQSKLKQAKKKYDVNAWDYDDYIITHPDLSIQINDDSAVIKIKNNKKYIDIHY